MLNRKKNWQGDKGFNGSSVGYELDNVVKTWNQHDAGTLAWNSFKAKGTTTNDNAAAGYIGEHVSARVTVDTNFSATATWNNQTSISLTAGDWDVSAAAVFDSGTATGWVTSELAISINSGATTTDHQMGDNQVQINRTHNATDYDAFSISGYRLSLSATTTVYLKGLVSYTGGNVGYRSRISARRMR